MELGTIQGIEINDEGQLKIVWFVQERIRNVAFKKLKQRNFKISDVLTKEGYQIKDPNQFDLDLKHLLQERGKEVIGNEWDAYHVLRSLRMVRRKIC